MERMTEFTDDMKYIIDLEEENKNLNERVSELEDVSKDYDLLSKDFIALGEENKNLRDYADNLDSENDNQAIEIEELKKENKKLKKYYDRDKEELMESCYSLAKEKDELKKKLEQIKEAYIRFEDSEKDYNKGLGELDQLIMNR